MFEQSIIVIDNFYSNVEDVINYSKDLKYINSDFEANGAYTECYINYDVQQIIQNYMTHKILNWENNISVKISGKKNKIKLNGRFYRVSSKTHKKFSRFSEWNWAGILFLKSENKSCKGIELYDGKKKDFITYKINRLVLFNNNKYRNRFRFYKNSQNSENQTYAQIFSYDVYLDQPIWGDFNNLQERITKCITIPILDKEICNEIIKDADTYLNNHSENHQLKNKQRFNLIKDIQLKNINTNLNTQSNILMQKLNDILLPKIMEICENVYLFNKSDYILKECYIEKSKTSLVKYENTNKSKDKNELSTDNFLRDKSLISFEILLNDENEFEGGEMYLNILNSEIQIQKGEILIYCGKLYHFEKPLIKGYKYAIYGSIDINSERINSNFLSQTQHLDLDDETIISNILHY